MESSKPHILYAVPPREGHMRPALQIVKYLTSHDFQVTVLGTSNWRDAIEAVGASWEPIVGLWKHLDDPSRWPKIVNAIVNIGTPLANLQARLDDGFVSLIPSGYMSTRSALESIARRVGRTRVVVLSDVCFSGTLPLKLGGDLPEGFESADDIKTIGIGVVPVFWASEVRPPWGWGLPLEDTVEARIRNVKAYKLLWDEEAEQRGRMVLDILNCPKPVDTLFERCHPSKKAPPGQRLISIPPHPFWDASTICHDVTLQMCLPSLEYPSDDFPSHIIKFAGTLPLKPLPPDLVYPPWFETEVRSRPTNKKVILVAQGTEVLDHNQLLVPTIRGLAANGNILVVAVLCVKGATLAFPSDEALPSNVRVLDYFPYDAILAHADVFVSNSGYGGFSHAVANGVPMVQTGKDFDKPDIGRRVEWSGLGVYLDNPPPSPEQVKEAVEKVLGDDGYRRRALELRLESEGYDPLGAVEKEIMGLVW